MDQGREDERDAPARVTQRQLDEWARACHDAYGDLTLAEARLVRDADVHAARQFLHPAREEMWHTLQSLVRAGAERPSDAPGPGTVPLALLDTDNTRRLVGLVSATLAAAEAVREERGGPGRADAATRARADSLRLMLADLEAEVFGPRGLEGA